MRACLTLLLCALLTTPALAAKRAKTSACSTIESTGGVAWGTSAEHAKERAMGKADEAWRADVIKQKGAESMNMKNARYVCSQAGAKISRRWNCRVVAEACKA